MKGSKLLKKAAAAFFAAALCMSFAAVANAQDQPEYSYQNDATYEDVIQFSSYDISQGTETRVKNPSWTVSGYKTSYLDQSHTNWQNGDLSYSTAGSLDGKHLCYQTASEDYAIITNTVTIEDVPTGYYTVSQYIPYQTLGLKISVQNESDESPTVVGTTNVYTNGYVQEWVELGTVYLSGDVTFTYTNTSEYSNKLRSVRIDETMLVKQAPEKKEVEATKVEDIDENGDGASVWEATVDFDGEYSYTKLGVSAKLRETGEEKDGTAVNMPTISGKSSVYAVIAVNKLSEELDWVKVTVE